MKKQLLTAILLASVLASASCGSASDTEVKQPDNGTEAVNTAAITEEADVYPYETPDLGGYTLRVCNMDALWNMYIRVDTDTTDGEVLNDAVYNRNRAAEQKLNFVIEEIRTSTDDCNVHNTTVSNAVLSGEDSYDVTYASVHYKPAMIAEGYFLNLHEIEGLHLNEAWWDAVVAENTTIHDCTFTATSPMHMMPYDSAWILFFNQDMMEQNDMELPYQLVRDGKWTIDALHTYTKSIANLNGDSDFKWDKNGNAIYGIAAHPDAPAHFITASGEYTVRADQDGELYFAPENDRYYSVISALAKMLDTSAGSALAASSDDFNADLGGYMHTFHSGRSLFLTAEIKAAQLLRDMDATFGVVPLPKLDETQEDYRCDFVQSCLFYTIPVTNAHLYETAVASDYLSYLGMRDILPIYYENVVEQKGLRNEDSIEMLDIVLSNKTIDIANVFGWGMTLNQTISKELFKGSDAIASILEKQKSKIEKSIQDILGAIAQSQENS